MASPSQQSEDSGDELGALLEAELASPPEAAPAAKRARHDGGGGGGAAAAAAPSRACPPHPGFLGGLCIRCGALKPSLDAGAGAGAGAGGDSVALRYLHHGLEVSAAEAARLAAATLRRVAAARKLLLVLDLDHTLLNSTRCAEVDAEPEVAARLAARLAAQDAALAPRAAAGEAGAAAGGAPPPAAAPDQPQRELYHLPALGLWTKLRPGVRPFLAAAARLFELHIYTMGDAHYAAAMASLLDPGGRLFAGRIMSSADVGARAPGGGGGGGGSNSAAARAAAGAWAKDLDVVLGAEAAVLVLDDTPGVWPRHGANLMVIGRYVFFPACAARFGVPAWLDAGDAADEDAGAGPLAAALRVMRGVHAAYFEAAAGGAAADVRPALAAARRRVLAGARVLFTAVVPLGWADPAAHPAVRLATELGADVAGAPGAGVTHVVAGAATDKVRWARGAGVPVVTPEWLAASAAAWARADEAAFALGAAAAAGGAGAGAPRAPADDLAAALGAAGGGRGAGGGEG